MEYFMEVFGDISVGWVAIIIASIVFLLACYKKVDIYFSEKAVFEHEKDKEIKKVIDQAKQYPVWHQQSISIQKNYNNTFGRMSENLDNVTRSIEDLKREITEGRIVDCRYRILRFDDEVRHDERHSKEHFDQILDDITEYENYCDEHKEFKNNKAVLAIANIKKIYQRCVDDNTFI